ncbi:MAG: chromosome condensation regulator [Hyperionvirus sp.]|uniref:Chromosome condensation regulator n=1 Tax=Hyperionvirus sp. TaxID=2487770 RepID=A0A3G5ACE6_9VIRU|nr:MAG: chromosome condensation regulator [Hyperionvirus sp.]
MCFSLFRDLPIDLQYIVLSYNSEILLHLDELNKYDWFRLIKLSYGFSYSKDACTNEEIMKVYLDNCRRSKKIFGGMNTIVMLDDGRLMSRGYNASGQCGLGDKKDRQTFEVIQRLPNNIADVTCSGYHSIIRCTDGRLLACGYNRNGQLGLGDFRERTVFQLIKKIDKNIAEVQSGGSHSIIRLTDGTLMGCGSNLEGQLGMDLGEGKVQINRFKTIASIPKDIVKVVCGCSHTIIRSGDGTLMGCGKNTNGELGFADGMSRYVFKEILDVPKNIAEVVSCGYNTFIRLTDGTLMASGHNHYGQLGLGDNIDRFKFEKIVGIPKNIVEVSGGPYHTIIRLADGVLMGSGFNEDGRLGFLDKSNRNIFEVIPGEWNNLAEVYCGEYYTMVRLKDGTVMSCGYQQNHQVRGFQKVMTLKNF